MLKCTEKSQHLEGNGEEDESSTQYIMLYRKGSQVDRCGR